MYRYSTYSEVPGNCATLICNVAGCSSITELTISEINDFLSNLEDYYEKYSLTVSDFIE